MAKDNRKSKATRSGTGTATATKRRKNKKGRRIVAVAMLIFVVLAAVLVAFAWNELFGENSSGSSIDSDLNVPDTTPVEAQKKVAYYVVGLLGADETAPTEALMLVAYDKGKNTINVLEVPQDTYLGDSDLWSVKKAGAVWGNPAPLDWCDFEGKRIYKAEIADHVAAGHPVSQRKGSASYNLISVFNELYSLPVDEHFMIPQAGFVKLVNLVGGINVNLDANLKVGDVTYKKGIATLDGDAALQYILTRKKGVQGDLDRIVRQRQVFLALFQRLCGQTKQELEEESLAPVMRGSTPIRTNMSTADLVALVQKMATVKAENMTAQLLPGESSTFNSDAYYSVHRADLITQLNTYFNPYGETITEADIQVVELAKGSGSDVHFQVLSEIAVDQSNTTTATKPESAE